ncbi:DUF982 domain-containing protein (plasmid) [Rhizobium sp. RCAM05350]|nr:DUF982 domain-containing protein [Rhizobium sp. RCAM05350]
MNNSIWDVNVELAMNVAIIFMLFGNAREAIACLTTRWPDIKGSSYALARQICLAALEGTKSNAEARAAFEAAADEAGILKRN